MKISVVIDSNAWNFLFDRNIDLRSELPPEDFALYIMREVEIEISAIPDLGKDGSEKRSLKQYIHESIAQNQVVTTATFGFAEANPADGPATYAGFGRGTFQSDKEHHWYAREEIQSSLLGKPKKGSGLSANQADTAVSAASFDSIVLTCDKKNGPISKAKENGGMVVFLSDELLSLESLQQVLRSVAGK
ncbi:hypothetical protein [Chromohalobacter sp. 11-W]|uniref:hypothetical protein n=1 Tax=Chromohalobacter sp. 11-W TaxID=2994061 RepID=UPI0024691753|nr:hypothetical protein [Chromohalobacter sp. 11-W]